MGRPLVMRRGQVIPGEISRLSHVAQVQEADTAQRKKAWKCGDGGKDRFRYRQIKRGCLDFCVNSDKRNAALCRFHSTHDLWSCSSERDADFHMLKQNIRVYLQPQRHAFCSSFLFSLHSVTQFLYILDFHALQVELMHQASPSGYNSWCKSTTNAWTRLCFLHLNKQVCTCSKKHIQV